MLKIKFVFLTRSRPQSRADEAFPKPGASKRNIFYQSFTKTSHYEVWSLILV